MKKVKIRVFLLRQKKITLSTTTFVLPTTVVQGQGTLPVTASISPLCVSRKIKFRFSCLCDKVYQLPAEGRFPLPLKLTVMKLNEI